MKKLEEKQLTTKEYYRNSFLTVTEDENDKIPVKHG